MEPFVKIERDRQPTLLHIRSWEERYAGLTAGFSSRLGGVSDAPFASLNCGLHVGDEPERVLENRKRVAGALQVPFEAWTCAEQVHGDRVHVVTGADKGKGRASLGEAIPQADALVTGESGIWLTGFYADCVPLYFYDPVRRAVGLAHAGWRGTVRHIAARTVEKMRDAFGSEPERLVAAIGPSIGMCCYEVDEAVQRQVAAATEHWSFDPNRPMYREAEKGKFMLNLQEINREIMIKAGILPSNIEISKLCTGCRTELFFSHRKENGQTGRMMSWIGIGLQQQVNSGDGIGR